MFLCKVLQKFLFLSRYYTSRIATMVMPTSRLYFSASESLQLSHWKHVGDGGNLVHGQVLQLHVLEKNWVLVHQAKEINKTSRSSKSVQTEKSAILSMTRQEIILSKLKDWFGKRVMKRVKKSFRQGQNVV